MKTCSRCKEDKTLENFYKNKSTGDGLQSHCKACNLEAVKASQFDKRRRAERRIFKSEEWTGKSYYEWVKKRAGVE